MTPNCIIRYEDEFSRLKTRHCDALPVIQSFTECNDFNELNLSCLKEWEESNDVSEFPSGVLNWSHGCKKKQ